MPPSDRCRGENGQTNRSAGVLPWWRSQKWTNVIVSCAGGAAILFCVWRVLPQTYLNILRLAGDACVSEETATLVESTTYFGLIYDLRYKYGAGGQQVESSCSYPFWTYPVLKQAIRERRIRIVHLKCIPAHSALLSNTAAMPFLLLCGGALLACARTCLKALRSSHLSGEQDSACVPGQVAEASKKPSATVRWVLRPCAWLGITYVVVWCAILLPHLEPTDVAGLSLRTISVFVASAIVLIHVAALCACLVLSNRGQSVGRETPILLIISLVMLSGGAWYVGTSP